VLVATTRIPNGGETTTTVRYASVPSRKLSEKINGLIDRKGGTRLLNPPMLGIGMTIGVKTMTLGELPVGACWVCKGRLKEVGSFVRLYEVLYTDRCVVTKFRDTTPVTDVEILFLPVELV